MQIPLPDRWWVLFDAEWEDVWTVCGFIMTLYHAEPCQDWKVEAMMDKKDVRQWVEEHPTT